MTRFDALLWLGQALAGAAPPLPAANGDWETLLLVASEQRVAGALCGALERAGTLSQVPETYREALELLRTLGRERNAEVIAQARHLADALNAAGVPFALLKGTAHVASGLHSDAGERLLGDIDLLVVPEQLAAAVAALRGAGYAVQDAGLLHADGEARGDVHYPPLAHASWPLVVEVHWAVLPGAGGVALPAPELLQRAREITLPGGASARVLHPADALAYGILHAELRHWAAVSRGLQLWNLFDTLLLARALDPSQRDGVTRRLASPELARALRSHGESLGLLFGEAIPAPLRRNMPRWVRARVRHQVNATALGALDAACCRAAQALGNEADNIARQWRTPERRAALLRKVADAGSYRRRLRNVWARLRGPHR